MGVLWVIESFEPSARKEFILEIKAKEAAKLQPKVEALLRRRRVKYELRESNPEEFSYLVNADGDEDRRHLGRDYRARSRSGHGRRMEDGRKKKAA